MQDIDYSSEKYLASKKAVDDESLNREVWNALDKRLKSMKSDGAFQILEIGAGIGSMIERAVEWNLLPSETSYTAVEIDEGKVETGKKKLQNFAEERDYCVKQNKDDIILKKSSKRFTINFKKADAFEVVDENPKRYNLLIAHAFLDLVDLDKALPKLLSALEEDGLFYFPITFDGVTTFRPHLDNSLESKIERVYHGDMDNKNQKGIMGGSSITGRRLMEELLSFNYEIIRAGSSDWIVYPGKGGYGDDLAYFLHHIVHLVMKCVERSEETLAGEVQNWAEIRHRQIENEELIYIAHQLDILGKV